MLINQLSNAIRYLLCTGVNDHIKCKAPIWHQKSLSTFSVFTSFMELLKESPIGSLFLVIWVTSFFWSVFLLTYVVPLSPPAYPPRLTPRERMQQFIWNCFGPLCKQNIMFHNNIINDKAFFLPKHLCKCPSIINWWQHSSGNKQTFS